MTTTLLLTYQYFPPIEYFARLAQADQALLEIHESFQKQTYRNRANILTSQGIQRLTVPVMKANRHTPITEVKIDYSEKWENLHWRALKAAYGKSPFFDHYGDLLFQPILEKPASLLELNEKILKQLINCLSIKAAISHTDSFKKSYPENVTDLRDAIHPKKPHGMIHVNGYLQNFGEPFVENLSILDLLFAEGPYSKEILSKQSFQKNNQKA